MRSEPEGSESKPLQRHQRNRVTHDRVLRTRHENQKEFVVNRTRPDGGLGGRRKAVAGNATMTRPIGPCRLDAPATAGRPVRGRFPLATIRA